MCLLFFFEKKSYIPGIFSKVEAELEDVGVGGN